MGPVLKSHITNNLANLEQVTHTYGKEEIKVGNGEKLCVQQTGVASINCNQQNLKLIDVLYAPKVTKNLISVFRLTKDSNVLIEFDSSRCFVKDKATWEVLLKGEMKQDLYELKENQASFN